MYRRSFLQKAALGSIAISSPALFSSCKEGDKNSNSSELMIKTNSHPLLLSLAQWSLHRQFLDKKLDPNDFALIAKKTFDIDAIEYVNQFYVDVSENVNFWMEMKQKADDHGVNNLLIMVDDEGDLGVADENMRLQAVSNHYKWVDAASLLGCHSIRVNAFGESDQSQFTSAIINSMGRLASYAAEQNINIIIENHGLFSSNGKMIADIVNQVGLPNFGTFPDFGNWCQSAKWGSISGECENVYDPYQGVADFLPYAKAVSAKSYEFEEDGSHPLIDYKKMLQLVKNSDYRGHIGIEYEGSRLSENQGILATKRLIEQIWSEI